LIAAEPHRDRPTLVRPGMAQASRHRGHG